MLARQPYTPAKIFVDFGVYRGAAKRCHCNPGCYVVSRGPRARAAYLVQSVRESKTVPGRRHLAVLRWPREEVPNGACVHDLHWYPREAKRAQRLRDLQPAQEGR